MKQYAFKISYNGNYLGTFISPLVVSKEAAIDTLKSVAYGIEAWKLEEVQPGSD